MNKLKNNRLRKLSTIKRRFEENPVQDGLAVSPAQMVEMTRKGIAISTQNQPDSVFEEGSTINSFDIPLEHRRGVDLVQLWEASESAKKKIRSARKKDIETYGQYNPNLEGKE